MEVKKISQEAFDVIDQFNNLDFGENKKVVAPYYMNLKGQRGGLRVMVGKGSPEEIIQEVKVWAQVKGFDVANASSYEIRKFMIDMNIGIDCSAFAVYVLNAHLKSLGLGPLWQHLSYSKNSPMDLLRRFFRPVENTGANEITSENNCLKVENLNKILPGDLIRAKGKQRNAHHIGIITVVEFGDDGKINRFEYANSHRFYEDQNGVRIGEVIITDPDGDLKDQDWTDTLNERNYFYEDLMVNYEDNGIRRLKVLST